MLNDDVLNAADVASILHIGRNAVYDLAKAGSLPSYKMGRKLYFTLADVKEYLAHARQGGKASKAEGGLIDDAPHSRSAQGSVENGRVVGNDEGAFVIAGNGLAADLIAEHLVAFGSSVSRSYRGSYKALVDVYKHRADAALIHLYDQRTNSYNVPFVLRLAPGTPVIVIRLLKRMQGFAVAKGNPQAISSWGALLRSGIRLANRQRGCGSRVLLDEKLLDMEAAQSSIDGYHTEYASGLAAARAVADGRADVTVVCEDVAAQVKGVDFVPLQTEWLDLVVAKNERTRETIRRIKELMGDESFRAEYSRVTHGDPVNLGAIVYEC